ncbi:hypothetical protein DLAC_06823 [Tieghemostelium lacteum]|uniref:Uncharacterized protein n=1 Tax=Tieghemostelium lacteum TaxID=361077 RepID=A0A151ZDL7_TIELA|nr:hypothetical protein DLAC_06823 [Tieghemostelium lacteum]|eukprot:KYQ92000.1 hypothetical protein DLAC_06823 [Tieghemostelium lacteum]
MTTTIVDNNQLLKKQFYRNIYIKNSIELISICAYCGCSNIEKCSCGNKKYSDFRFTQSYNPNQLLDLIEVFIEWCSTTTLDKFKLIREYCSDQNNDFFEDLQTNNNSPLNQKLPDQILLFMVRFIIDNPTFYYRFYEWMDSKIELQRLIIYFILLRSKDQENLDLVFSRLISDITIFNILKPLPIFVNSPSSIQFLKLLKEIAEEKDEKILEQISYNSLFIDPPTYDIAPQLCSDFIDKTLSPAIISDGVDNYHQNFITMVCEKLTKKEYLKQNIPFQQYHKIVLFLFLQYETSNELKVGLDNLYNHYKQEFSDYVKHYMLAGVSNHNTITLVNIIYNHDRFNIDVSDCSTIFNEIILKINIEFISSTSQLRRHKILSKIKSIDEYYSLIIYKIPLNTYAINILIQTLPKESINQERITFVEKNGDQNEIFYYMALLKCYSNDKNSLIRSIRRLCQGSTIDIQFFGADEWRFDPNNLEVVFQFEKDLRGVLGGGHQVFLPSSPFTSAFVYYLWFVITNLESTGYDREAILKTLGAYSDTIFNYFGLEVAILLPSQLNGALFHSRAVTKALVEGSPVKSQQYFKEHFKAIIGYSTQYNNVCDILEMLYSYYSTPSNDSLFVSLTSNHFRKIEALEKLMLDKDHLQLPEKLKQFCEVALKLCIIQHKLPVNPIEIVKQNLQLPLDKLYNDVQIRDNDDMDKLEELLDSTSIFLKSPYFKKFYYQLPIRSSFSNKYSIYLLDQEEKRQESYRLSIAECRPYPAQLPHSILKIIIHFLYHDINYHSQYKFQLALVSKTFMNLCSLVLSNNFNFDVLNNYITIKMTTKINTSHPLSLWRDYPKLVELKMLKYLPMPIQSMDKYFHDHLEASYISFNSHMMEVRLLCTRQTNLRIIEIEFENPQTKNSNNVLQLFEKSPLLERINLTITLTWEDLDEYIASILKLKLQNLNELVVYLNHKSAHRPLHLVPIKKRLTFHYDIVQFPKLYLKSIPGMITFDGFDFVNVRLSDPVYQRDQIALIYNPILSQLRQIKFSVPDFHQYALPLVQLACQHSNIHEFAIRSFKYSYEDLDLSMVQQIFDLLSSQSSSIEVFSIYYSIFLSSPKTSILKPNIWKSNINTKQFQPDDCNNTIFYRQLPK